MIPARHALGGEARAAARGGRRAGPARRRGGLLRLAVPGPAGRLPRHARAHRRARRLAAVPDSAAYRSALDALPAALDADAAAITATIGADRYAQLRDLVEVEARSLPIRLSWNDAARELLIRERIVKALAGAGASRVAVNCGMFHAQKARPPGAWEPVGSWLAAHPESYGGDPSALRSIAFLGARGELKDHFYDTGTRTFDVRDAPEHDLVRILAERAGAQDAWLPFSDPLFSTTPVELDAGGTIAAAVPAAFFDGLVLYPQVSVLTSLALLPQLGAHR